MSSTIILATLSLLVLSLVQAQATRNPRLFLVTTSSTTSTLMTSSICYSTAAGTAVTTACTGKRKKRAILSELIDSHDDDKAINIQPSGKLHESEGKHVEELMSTKHEEGDREARLLNGLLYWITTTTTSTTTSFTTTITIAGVKCTTAGATFC